MASTYTINSGIEKPGSGEQSGTWGDTTNTNFDIIDRALNGVGAITLSGTTHTLTTSDGSLSDGHFKVLVLGGSPSGTNTITISPNDQDKLYLVKNGSGQTATFTQGSGGNASVANGDMAWIFADGAGSSAAVTTFTVNTSQINDSAITSAKIADGTIVTADIADSAITSAKIADGTIVTADLADSAITTAKIADGTIATADIADNAVNYDKIADNTIVGGNIANNTITAAQIAADAVGASELANDAVDTAAIADDAVTAAKLASDAVVNASVASGAAIAFSKMANLTASRALVSDGNGDVSVSAVTSTEIGYLDGVTSSVQTQINNIAGYPQVITILTSGNYSIPSDAQAIMIRASGGGGGGTTLFASGGGLGTADGTDGGSTTVSNSTLSISITATGGRAAHYTTSNISTRDVISGSTGGDVIVGAGAAGGRSTAGQGGNFTYDGPPSVATKAQVVHKYVTGNSVGGETLTISYGAAGAAGNSNSTAGQAGYVEIWVW